MLQQTQAATVVPYYRRFIRRFPNVRRLAAAPLDDVLQVWTGLGYYARARHLHRAAKMIVEEFGGVLPRTAEALRRLPGVGAYSAAAVASIAFGQPTAVVDGNVKRVVARLYGLRDDVSRPAGLRRVTAHAQMTMPARRCGDFNQAMMELGASICRPAAAARCAACPLKTDCAARAAGDVAKLPLKGRKGDVRSETHVVAALTRNRRWLVLQRPADGLWGGLWELPCRRTDSRRHRQAAMRLADEVTDGRALLESRRFCDVTQTLTHRRIRFVGYPGTVAGATPRRVTRASLRGRLRWATLEQIGELPMSRGMKDIVKALSDRTSDRRGSSAD